MDEEKWGTGIETQFTKIANFLLLKLKNDI